MTPVDARAAGVAGVAAEVTAATETLARAGIAAARVDAELLAAHVLGVDRGRLRFAEPAADFAAAYRRLVAARAQRIPLQHLVGTAPFGPLTLAVGPGVFVPRPETESLLEWAMAVLDEIAAQPNPIVVDACTGSGALAVALARHRPDATVIAIDDSPAALDYARRNAAGTGVELVEADVTAADLRTDLNGRVDLLVSNPPYIPEGARLEPEVAEHDPHHALFGGADGMAVIGPLAALAGRWLKPGGRFAVEHDDTTSAATVDLIRDTGLFDEVRPRADLAGRPRFVTALRRGPAVAGEEQP
ncbi:release factor glutamine methyltransferase [Mycolicibacterium chitae]|uniref:Release factor glutamine methyltransferase n=1 Tax=Mycolicibacterium chitae TaxID=1792 RepID=A0A3S4RL62_MYCCI|nr:peptide chain release factor N(5)-glutamine methyltransferase [Mycolicibacterium chitae]MCV7104825.1 peptide chain release factor N(5)-glutamine methyltransferase [Mycolicibacterium chitae]BBZ03362.1 release factor glutamine methyltransferase [Mycolicibacterium chitae]VEG46826.1 modification methylase HemK [Mycolicibacterium chitae]